MCEALTFLLDYIYIRFGTELFRQIVGNPMGTNCAPLVADLFLFCYERDFMKSLSEESNPNLLKLSARRLNILDDLLNIDNKYFDVLISKMYPSKLNKTNSSKTDTPFLNLHLSISDEFISCKNYDKRDDFDSETVNFPYLDGDVSRRAS